MRFLDSGGIISNQRVYPDLIASEDADHIEPEASGSHSPDFSNIDISRLPTPVVEDLINAHFAGQPEDNGFLAGHDDSALGEETLEALMGSRFLSQHSLGVTSEGGIPGSVDEALESLPRMVLAEHRCVLPFLPLICSLKRYYFTL